jgi:hypothetical protein
MRLYFAAIAAAAALSFSVLPAPANAMTARTASGIQQGTAETGWVDHVRTVCRDDPATGRRTCWIDRSQPPTVCHWVRDRNGNIVRDCY